MIGIRLSDNWAERSPNSLNLQTFMLRRRIIQRQGSRAALELRRGFYGGGQVVAGLEARRQAE